MHIVFLTRRFFPEIGGVEKHVLEVAKILGKKGNKISIITTQPRRNNPKGIPESKNISVHYINPGNTDWFLKFRIWQEMWRLRQIWMKADVIHAHDVFFWILPFTYLKPRLKVYTTFHGYETVFPPTQKAIRARVIASNRSRGVINVGEFIRKWYGTKCDFVVYGGIDQIQNSKIKNQNYNSKLKIVFIGRIEVDNGFEIYSKSLEILKKANLQFEFEALGDGSKRHIFEQFGKVLGFVDNPVTYIKNADIIFASSYLSILESLNYGKIVFSVYQNELKKDYLLMTPFAKWIEVEYEPMQIAKKMQMLQEGKIVSNVKGASKWLEKNTWDDVVKVYEKLWEMKK